MKMQAPFIASNLALAQSKEKVIGWAITFWYNTQVGISIHWKKKNYMIAKCLHCAMTQFKHYALYKKIMYMMNFYIIISTKFQNILNLICTMLRSFDFKLFLYGLSKLLRDYHKRVLRFKINIRIPISIFLLKHLTWSRNTINQFQN